MVTTQLTIANKRKLTSMAGKNMPGNRRHKEDEKTQVWQSNITIIANKHKIGEQANTTTTTKRKHKHGDNTTNHSEQTQVNKHGKQKHAWQS